jgi:hypothetical protein
MANQSWVSLLNPASPQASGAGAILNTATTATISPVAGGANASDVAQVQPAGQPYGWYPGLLVRVTAQGFITTTATSTTATFFLASRVGNAGTTWVTLATSAGIATGTGALTGIPWTLTSIIRCTSIATSGNTVSTQGQLSMTHNTTAPTLGATSGSVDLSAYLPASSGETAAAVDTTQLQGISLRGTLAAANATVQLTQWLVEAMD